MQPCIVTQAQRVARRIAFALLLVAGMLVAARACHADSADSIVGPNGRTLSEVQDRTDADIARVQQWMRQIRTMGRYYEADSDIRSQSKVAFLISAYDALGNVLAGRPGSLIPSQPYGPGEPRPSDAQPTPW